MNVIEIQIGDYTLTKTSEGKLWLSKDGGESMEMSEEDQFALEILLEQFWEANF